MKRVLHLWSGNLFGGVESFLLELCGRGRRYEHQVGLSLDGPLASRLSRQNTVVHRLGHVRMSRPWSVFASRRRLERLLDEEGFAAVISHGFWPHVVWSRTVMQMNVPLVFFQHDITEGKHWLERMGARIRPTRYIANSQASQAALLKLMPHIAGRVVHPPVEPSPPRTRAVRNEVRSEFGVQDDVVVILQIGRLEWYKGHWLLLEALQQLPGSTKWECWFVGGAQRPREAAYLSRLQQMAASGELNGRVRFLGQRDDVLRLLEGADIFCQPNVKPEAFGLVFIEALSSGVPVVAVASGALPEIVDDTCGRLVPADPRAVASALTELLLNPGLRDSLGSRGPSRADWLCSPVRQVAQIEDEISEVATR